MVGYHARMSSAPARTGPSHASSDVPMDRLSEGLMQLLRAADPEVAEAMGAEAERQATTLELIASENHVSPAVMHTMGSWMTNKYAEGYPGKRYYGGCQFHDRVEDLARDRAKRLFGCRFANVQPHCGANANIAAFMALCEPGDTILSLPIKSGGHLSHGLKPNFSGTFYRIAEYGLHPETERLDYDAIEAIARECRPKMIICGYSAYSRTIDFARFRAIADEVGAYLMVDMAHYAGLIAAGLYPNPVPHAHVTTSTTHKTLRGPRGGIILTNDEALAKKLNSAVFPGNQGGPLMHVIAAKAVAFGEALQPSFKDYAARVIANAQTLAATLQKGGLDIVSGGTDCHMVLVDLRPKGVKGRDAERALERAGLTCNKNAIPFDPEKPFVTSGVRLGTSAGTTRGFGEAEFAKVGELVLQVVDALADSGADGDPVVEAAVLAEVRKLTDAHPIYAD